MKYMRSQPSVHASTPKHGLTSWLMLLLLLVLFPQSSGAQSCSLCGSQRVAFKVAITPNCTMKLTYLSNETTYSAGSLPKKVEGYIKIDNNEGAQSITSGSAGEMKDINVQAELTAYPQNVGCSASCTFGCGAQLKDENKNALYLWHYAPPPPPNNAGGDAGAGGTDTGGDGSGGSDGDPGGWKDVFTYEGRGYATEADAQAALAALQAQNPDTESFQLGGSVSMGPDGTYGYSATARQYYEPTAPGGGGGGDGGGSPDTNPPEGPPTDNTPPPDPPADQLDDELTLEVQMPDTGTGGDPGGEIGEGGMDPQPSPPPGGDDDPQPLPMSWVWDFGSDINLAPIGTLAFVTDLSKSNPLDLSRFTTRAARAGGLSLTAMTGLSAGQSGWQVQASTSPLIRMQVVKVSSAQDEVRRFKWINGAWEDSPSAVYRFELTTAAGLPAIKRTVIIGSTSSVDVSAGTVDASGGRTWYIKAPDGAVRSGTEAPWANNQLLTDESTYSDSGAQFLQRTVTQRVKKPWGVEITQQSVYFSDAVGTIPVVTNYVFFEDPTYPERYGKLKWRTCTDGTWERYDYLATGETRVSRPWKDGPADPESVTLENCRSTLTSADGATTTEYIAGQVVSVTKTLTFNGMQHPWSYLVQYGDPLDPTDPNSPPQMLPEYVGSNLLDSYRCVETRRYLSDGGDYILDSFQWTNNRTGRADYVGDESGNMTVYVEFQTFLQIPGGFVSVAKRIKEQQVQPWEEGVPAVSAPLQEIEYIDNSNRTRRTEILAPDGSVASYTDYTYDGSSSRQTQVVRDGVVIYSLQPATDGSGNSIAIQTDSQGVKTQIVISPTGEQLSQSKLGVDGTTVLLTTTSTTVGLTTTTTTTGGGLTLSSSVTKDVQERMTQEVDENGVVTNYEYQDNGRTLIVKDETNHMLKATRQYLDGQLKSIEGPAVVAEYHDYSVDSSGLIMETVTYGAANGTMYHKQVTNGLGQLLQDIAPPQDGGTVEKTTQYNYDDNGRVSLTLTTGMAPVLTLYDGLSRPAVSRVLMGGIDGQSNADPLTTKIWSYEVGDTGVWQVSVSRKAVDSNIGHDIVSVSKQQIGGGGRVQITPSSNGAILTQTYITDFATATVATAQSSSQATRTATKLVVNGLVKSETSLSATTATTYTYDGLERQVTMTTPDGVVHKTVYDDAIGGAVRTKVLKEQVISADNSTTITQAAYTYDSRGRVKSVMRSDGSVVNYTYDAADHVLTQTGSGTYPLGYDYDSLGRLWKLHTYRNDSSDDITTWIYDDISGNLLSKTDSQNRKVRYAYNQAGQLLIRIWQRGVTTAYSYDGAGRQTSIDYSDTTPDVDITYDRSGRRTALTDAAGSHTFTYNDASGRGQLETWSVAGSGAWSGLSTTNGYINGQRVSRTTNLDSAITLQTATYTYDPLSGLTAGVSAGDFSISYRRNASTGWYDGITYAGGLKSTRTQDALGRIEGIAWSIGGATVSSHDYTLNAMSRRTNAVRQDGSAWNYGYNDRGEVISAAKGVEPSKQFSFEYDDIGNRTTAKITGTADATVMHTTRYTPNALNQYDSITHPQPGWLMLSGSANSGMTVTIDGKAPTQSVGTMWYHEQSVDNSSGSVNLVVDISASRPSGGRNGGPVSTHQKGSLFIPSPSEFPIYDQDGNQTSDARWNYTWDGENRLIAVEEQSGIVVQQDGITAVKRTRLEFSYDALGRRITKKVYVAKGVGGTFELMQCLVHIYDGLNMIAEIDTTTSAKKLLRSYEWGVDLSGTAEGAGGVGGLLIERFHAHANAVTNSLSSSGVHASLYDGNGNVTELFDLSRGSISARYEYGAFGEAISIEGQEAANANPFRFSTKYLDVETGLLNYMHRYYEMTNGRWLSRDPIGINGGINIYAMLENDVLNKWDYLGWFSLFGSKAKYKLSYTGKKFPAGDCGNFRWDVFWKVEGDNGGQAPTEGTIYQEVKHELYAYPCTPSGADKSRAVTFNLPLEKEAWSYPTVTGDTWSYGDQRFAKLASGYSTVPRPCAGKLVFTASAYFSGDAIDRPIPGTRSQPDPAEAQANPLEFPPNPAVQYADWNMRDTKQRLKVRSNTVVRKLTIEWDCCLGKNKTVITQ